MNVCEFSFDFIIITESWLNLSVNSGELFPANYHVLRCDRKFSKVNKVDGGGVIVGISDSVSFEYVDTTQITDLVPSVDLIICKCCIT